MTLTLRVVFFDHFGHIGLYHFTIYQQLESNNRFAALSPLRKPLIRNAIFSEVRYFTLEKLSNL